MRLLLGRNIEQQIIASFAWMSEVVTENDRILVDSPSYRRCFRFEFPVRPGDPPKVERRVRDDQMTFIMCMAARRQAEQEGWATIFATPAMSIREKRSREVIVPPLRWGLTRDEKRLALHIARETLRRFLTSRERPTPRDFPGLPQRFFHKADLGVATWINGRLRGSWIAEDQYLIEGLITAATNAGQDSRFKPPTNRDLARAQIEITIAHRLRLPLSAEFRAANRILPEKGYVFPYGAANGWYLPEVFNVRRFRTLEELLGDLAQEKVRLPRETHRKAKIFICEVDDFIESADRSRALSLSGPVVKPKPLVLDSTFLEQRLRMAADWLRRIQEPDGNIPPITDPFNGHQAQMDWPKLAFTAWALTEFSETIKEKQYLQAAAKSFEYLRDHFIKQEPRLPNPGLTYAYLGQLALSQGKIVEAHAAGGQILQLSHAVSFEPVVYSQIASFLTRLSNTDPTVRPVLKNLQKTLKRRFEEDQRNGNPMSLAAWAELANTFSNTDPSFARNVTAWLKRRQLPSGAFPDSTVSDFSYVRGSGKILEVLALQPQEHPDAIAGVLRWLLAMQYDKETTFFVPAENRSKVIGGFRHDYLNHEAWIDAAGHMLLGGARLLKSK